MPQTDSETRERALSPSPTNTRSSFESGRVGSPPPRPGPNSRAISEVQDLPHPNSFANTVPTSQEQRGLPFDAFQTSLPIRLDYEAAIAYLFLPPAGGVFLLIFEHKSDYVRFHAWQSSMLFTAIFVLHLLLSWSSVLSWILFAIDLVLIGFLTLHAYRDVETLDHFEVPFFGRLASRFVDDE